MAYFACFFLLMAAFWFWVSFRDARWVADEEGPDVWTYAFPGICMFVFSALGFLASLAAWVLE